MDFFAQSGCRDLNPGPLAPQTSTLTGLSYIPFFFSRAKLMNYSDNAKKRLMTAMRHNYK